MQAFPTGGEGADGSVPAEYPRQGLLCHLGLYGLSYLDAPVLAALASETPILLIGPHGSAKSALFERLAAALGIEHRHYNASLIAFDDLVGFPVPDGEGLRYLHTPATLWGAQSVFFDEISRCRPEVQNKLFSIIHEKRVQGLALERLRYRWAAMNPPAMPDMEEGQEVYAGSFPLDPALADRFGFVFRLPALEELPPQVRQDVIRSGLQPPAQSAETLDLPGLVSRCRQEAKLCAALWGEWITAYTAALVVPLQQAGLGMSGRRAAMLANNIAAVHAARRTLGECGAQEGAEEIAESALLALRHSLPHPAQGRPADAAVVTTIHRQAVDAVQQTQTDDALARILDEINPVRRVGLALATLRANPGRVSRHTMSLLVADALAAQDVQARWVLAQELLPEIVALDCVDAPTLELLARPFMEQLLFEERGQLRCDVPRSRIASFNALVAQLSVLAAGGPEDVALANLAASLYGYDERACDPDALLRQRQTLRDLLNGSDDHAR